MYEVYNYVVLIHINVDLFDLVIKMLGGGKAQVRESTGLRLRFRLGEILRLGIFGRVAFMCMRSTIM